MAPDGVPDKEEYVEIGPYSEDEFKPEATIEEARDELKKMRKLVERDYVDE